TSWRPLFGGQFKSALPAADSASAGSPCAVPRSSSSRLPSRLSLSAPAYCDRTSKAQGPRHAGQPGTPRSRLEEAAVALVDDHRAGVAAVEQVVDTREPAQLPGSEQGDVAQVGAGHEEARR